MGTLSLLDCFEDTVWELFEDPDIELHTSSVLSYISFCMDNVISRKQVKIFPKQKPWFNTNIRALLQARDSALRSRDREAYRKARADLNRGIKAAKTKYREVWSGHLLKREFDHGSVLKRLFKGKCFGAGN